MGPEDGQDAHHELPQWLMQTCMTEGCCRKKRMVPCPSLPILQLCRAGASGWCVSQASPLRHGQRPPAPRLVLSSAGGPQLSALLSAQLSALSSQLSASWCKRQHILSQFQVHLLVLVPLAPKVTLLLAGHPALAHTTHKERKLYWAEYGKGTLAMDSLVRCSVTLRDHAVQEGTLGLTQWRLRTAFLAATWMLPAATCSHEAVTSHRIAEPTHMPPAGVHRAAQRAAGLCHSREEG